MRKFYHKKAFTIIELMLVLVIIGIMSAIAIPTSMRRLHSQRLNAGATQLTTHLRQARQRAIKYNMYYRINLSAYTNAYFMEKTKNPLAAGSWQKVFVLGGDSNETPIVRSGNPDPTDVILLPKDIRVNGNNLKITFDSRGNLDPNFNPLPTTLILNSIATSKADTVTINFTGIPHRNR